MNTTFIITGGAGRVINSIPALEKYERLNPEDNFKVIVHGWDQLFWSHPTLQKRTFGSQQKGLFDQHIKNNKVVCPEPYHSYRFYNQKINLVEAFDECINNTEDHNDLNLNCLHLSEFESYRIKELAARLKEEKKKRKLVVFQPYGSGVEAIHKQPIDRSNRSLNLQDYFEIVKTIEKDAVIIYTSPPQFRHPNDHFSISIDEYEPYLRTMMGLISECDYFIGVCSVGQHMARAFSKPGLIIMGATSELNFSYPDHFDIYRKKDREPVYVPWRISDTDSEFSDRSNNDIMNFNNHELEEIKGIIKNNMFGKSTYSLSDSKDLSAKYE